MKAFMLFTGSGPLVILTSHVTITEPGLLAKFAAKGIDKFIAHELPLALARERYGGHFDVVIRGLHESDDLRILDYNGERAFRLFRLAELGRPILHEPA
ncbi:MAG: cytosolic protein [Geminicoccaceae bacterium]